MLILLAAVVAATTTTAAPDEDQRTERLATLYEQVCLQTFPDDKAVAAIMAARQARELSAKEVKITMRDDPARGWQLLDDPNATLWIEFPPYHACSVRWNTPRLGNLQSYRTIVEKYQQSVPGFVPMPPYEMDQGDIHIRMTGEQRPLPDQSFESLFIIDQQINDPKRRAAGETGVVLRFVHQFSPPPRQKSKK